MTRARHILVLIPLSPVSTREQHALALVDPGSILKYGTPGPHSDVINRPAVVGHYDRRMRHPSWVAEHITLESLAQSGGDRRNSVFQEDASIPTKFRATLQDYFRSGYDRGHMVPAADAKFSQEAMDGTFYLTNIAPQIGDKFNRDYWAHFEDFCRRVTRSYRNVRIITGPLYLPHLDPDGKWRVSYEVIGQPPNVSVPTHFYKVIVADGYINGTADPNDVSIATFVMPNAEIENTVPLTTFEAPLEAVERASGLELLSNVPTERRRSLCKQVQCSLLVRDFQGRNRQQQKLLPPPPNIPSLPQP